MRLQYKHNQDVTALDSSWVIAHCISVDCAMGKGVAVAVRRKYPGLKHACQYYVATHRALGTAYRYLNELGGVCYNLFTKRSVWDNAQKDPTYMDHLREALTDMRNQMVQHGETKLAIPKIAAGLDRADWVEVERMIRDVFADTEVDIMVCLRP